MVTVQGAQRRIHHGRVVIGRKCKIDQPEEVFQNLGVPLYAGLPILVYASLQMCLGILDLLWVGRSIVVIPGVVRDGVEVLGVCRFPPICE